MTASSTTGSGRQGIAFLLAALATIVSLVLGATAAVLLWRFRFPLKGVVDGTMSNMETLKGWKTGEVIKYATTTWKVGSCDTFYVVMSKKKWDSLPPDVQKVFNAVTEEYKEKWAKLWNDIDIEGVDFFKKQGGQVIELSDAELARWSKAAEPVFADFKKDIAGKGYTPAEIDSWLSFIKERIEYWKGQEKAKKIATVYKY